MARWKLSNQERNSVEEVEKWTKGSYVLEHHFGYRYGEFLVTTPDDSPPAIDLTNPSGLNLDELPYDFDVGDLFDQCWDDWSRTEGVPSEILDQAVSLFEGETDDEEVDEDEDQEDEDYEEPLVGMEALEADGWKNDDTVFFITGPLVLERLPD